MSIRYIALPALLVAVPLLGAATTTVSSASIKPPPLCGALLSARALSEPPDVDVRTLPKNAGGEPELILTVRRDRDRYCYRYLLDGSLQTVAPAIRVHRGDRFALRIVNEISSVTDSALATSNAIARCMPMAMPIPPAVHYVGYLNHPIDDRYLRMPKYDTNIHLHGFQGAASEENVFLSTLSTPQHACEYSITIPLTQPFGTYFYHPHAHGVSELQVAGGLSGAWIVEPDAPQIPRAWDHVIVLRYRVPFAPDNAFAPDTTAFGTLGAKHEASLKQGHPVAYDPFNPPPWPLTFPISAAGVTLDPSGCDGVSSETLLTVDGAPAPATLEVPAGRTQLLRILNATSDTPSLLQLNDAAGHALPLHVVARDGVPVGDPSKPLARYLPMSSVMVVPSGRADILVNVPANGKLILSGNHFCEGVDAFYEMHHDLLTIDAKGRDPQAMDDVSSAPLAAGDMAAAKLMAYARAHRSLVHRRAITFTEYMFPKVRKIPAHLAFFITDTTKPGFREHSFAPSYRSGSMVPDNPDITVKRGAIEEWYLINTTMEAHVFHIHQMAFVVEKDDAGMPQVQDSVFVPIGKLLANARDPQYPLVKPSITKVLMDFRNVPRGTFVFHCHMLFHEDHGMMAIIRVE
jgi:FtsP/CotA-like multicopper oxidase with cupredoxin domain